MTTKFLMYFDFYGFKENPFNITSDPGFIYFSEYHKEAFSHMQYGINQRKGFIEITGEIGSGKTTLCRAVLNALPPGTKSSYVFNSDLPDTQLLEAILLDFGIDPGQRTKISLLRQLNEFLIKELDQDNNAVLLIDEAQNIPNPTLEFIRMLSNLETEKEKLLQIVLVGQPELRDKLNSPGLEQLKQRITIRFHLDPLPEHEIIKYIDHRISVASPEKNIVFEEEATELIASYSNGIPRKINILCDKALLFGFVLDTTYIDKSIIQRSINELNGVFHNKFEYTEVDHL